LKYFGTDEPVVPPVDNSHYHRGETPDGDLLDRIERSKQGDLFWQLFSGDITGYPSASEADLGFCNILAFWTSKDAEQMDRLFRQSELMRPKWNEKHGAQTYGAMTISKAIDGCTEAYKGGQGQPIGTERKPDPKHRFQLIHYSKIGLKKPDWLVFGFMERDSLNSLFSDPGVGKSIVAVDLAASAATGQDFCGNFVKQGAVVFIAGEGQNGLKRRFMA
jgi:hypothetical protein